jgi:hypothetical protein
MIFSASAFLLLAAQGVFFRTANSIHLEVLVVSRWQSAVRRDNLRTLFYHCGNRLDGHQIGHTFFMADTKNLTLDEKDRFFPELVDHDDMVILPGHDSDPDVARDITYFLDRPTSRGYRIAHGSAWIVEKTTKRYLIIM